MDLDIKFSVVIPMYNTVNYVSACIDSVISQTYPAFEIILVNDGSTDGSDKVCEDYKNKYDNIIVVHKENGGSSSARNVGIRIARGDYIYFIDSDDLVKQNALKSFKSLLEKYGYVDFIHGRMSYFKDNPDDLYEWPFFFDNSWIAEPCSGQKAFCLLLKNQGTIQMGVRGVYNRTFLIENDLLFDEGEVNDDEDWTVRLFYYANTVVGNNNPDYCYREGRVNSQVNSNTLKLCIGKYGAYKNWGKIINADESSDEFIKSLIKERGRRFDSCIKMVARSLEEDQLVLFLDRIDENYHVCSRKPDSIKDLISLLIFRILGVKRSAILYNKTYKLKKRILSNEN